MTRPSFIVKVCGITNEQDARLAADAGANALGFNFYSKSPRYISARRAREIAAAAPGEYLKVGIFVNAAEPELVEIVAESSLDVVQLHGERVVLPRSSTLRIWRAIDGTRTPPAHDSRIEAYLLDSPAAQYGGSGEPFDWTLAARFPHPALIAGGLDASNVAEAIRAASPWGVDACSRLESSPGKKDPERVRAFVRAALAAARHEVTS
jgi:phosphoribosylanthranilate isomerase